MQIEIDFDMKGAKKFLTLIPTDSIQDVLTMNALWHTSSSILF